MNRKSFLRNSSLGLGLAILPTLASARTGKTPAQPKVVRDAEGEVLDVIGDIQTHKLVGSDTGGQLVEWVDNVEPGVGIPPHVHTREDEIFRVIVGEVEITVGDETTILRAGDTAFAPKHVPHTWKVVGTEKAKMITSAFPAGIEEMFHKLAELPAGPPDFGKVAAICGEQGITFV
ncbi:cupin domain-containing protein [Lewinella sp. IMCC34191]|uniref:cupin domain-containing protein n=1 Tax=Lewinella sp. IMCC34191 TaxID=2259172 RepID=UPI000E235BB1|nr:cupin domain-containing protein [Lewinella sp. IMCC34191]